MRPPRKRRNDFSNLVEDIFIFVPDSKSIMDQLYCKAYNQAKDLGEISQVLGIKQRKGVKQREITKER